MTGPQAPDSVRPTTRPSIPSARFAERLAKAQAAARAAGFDALLVAVGPDLAYLAGYFAMPLERLTMLVVPAEGTPTLVAPRLEATPARSCPAVAGGAVPLVTWEETEDPIALVTGLLGARLDAPRGLRPAPGASSPSVPGGASRRPVRIRRRGPP